MVAVQNGKVSQMNRHAHFCKRRLPYSSRGHSSAELPFTFGTHTHMPTSKRLCLLNLEFASMHARNIRNGNVGSHRCWNETNPKTQLERNQPKNPRHCNIGNSTIQKQRPMSKPDLLCNIACQKNHIRAFMLSYNSNMCDW